MFATLPWPLEVALNLALVVIDAYARVIYGRGFATLSDSEAVSLLRRPDLQSVGFRYALRALMLPIKAAYFDADRIRDLYPTPAEAVVRNPRAPKESARIHDHAADSVIECDVVVVGTGAGGAVIAKELAESGAAVVMIEDGAYFDRSDFSPRAFAMQRALYRRSGATFAIGSPFIPIPLGRTVGGSTTVNSGTCYRTPDRILSRWAKDLGEPEFEPSAFARHFERVEAVLGVSRARNELLGRNAEVIARGASAYGFKSHGPLSRNAPDCERRALCCFGCPTEAKRSTNVSYVPMALQAGAELYTGFRVERIVREGDAAVGVVARSSSGSRLRVNAKRTVIAAGAIMTPALLAPFARGLPALGRSLSIHPSVGLLAEFEERIAGSEGIPQGYAIEDWIDEGILFQGASLPIEMTLSLAPHWGEDLVRLAERFDHVATFGMMVEDRPIGRVRVVRGEPHTFYQIGAEELAKVQRGIDALARVYFAAGAKRVYAPIARYEVFDGLRAIDAFRSSPLRARDVELSAYHPLGTARMGRTASDSVVDTTHRVHGVRGLYVVDGASVPTPLGVNPQITIMAMATRAAEKLHQQC